MAVVREVQGARTGKGFQVIIRKRGYALSRVFGTKRDAQDWGKRVEADISISGPDKPFNRIYWLDVFKVLPPPRKPAVAEKHPDTSPVPSARWTLKRAMEHYANTVLSGTKAEKKALARTGAWEKRGLSIKALADVTRADVQAFIAERLAQGRAANTIRNDVFTLSALFTVAIEKWDLDLRNPVRPGDLPPPPAGRQARLQDAQHGQEKGDERRLLDALRNGPDAVEMRLLFALAVDTGMRRGELVGLRRKHLMKEGGTSIIRLPDSKNGHPRRVVLTQRAARILSHRAKGRKPGDWLFSLSGDGVQYRLEKAREAAGLAHVRFHDLRHEALSRMASMGLTIGELQAQSGHTTAQILLRYVNARAGDIAKKLG